MTREEVYVRLTDVFRDVFDREVALSDSTTAADIPSWDSFTHITLIGAIEDEFAIKIPLKDVIALKNLGDIVSKILELNETGR